MNRHATIYKKIGETPFSALERYRRDTLIDENVPIAYAGRLDPMAEGKLLLLTGDECKKQKKYFGLDKRYECEILLDFKSDTGDVLGLVDYSEHNIKIEQNKLQDIAKKLRGKHALLYPRYSSKTVGGKPLFLHSLEGTIDTIVIPKTDSQIYTLEIETGATITKTHLKDYIFTKISSIPKVQDERKLLGKDFRREEIKVRWEKIFHNLPDTYSARVLSFTCIASSGTYMRTLAEIVSEHLNTTGLALSIKRTHIGKYKKVIGEYGIWTKKY